MCEQAVVLLVEKVKAKRSKLKEGKEAEERQKTTQAEDLDNTNYKPKNIKTMRKNIVAGNWKMNKTLQEGVELAKGVEAALQIRWSVFLVNF